MSMIVAASQNQDDDAVERSDRDDNSPAAGQDKHQAVGSLSFDWLLAMRRSQQVLEHLAVVRDMASSADNRLGLFHSRHDTDRQPPMGCFHYGKLQQIMIKVKTNSMCIAIIILLFCVRSSVGRVHGPTWWRKLSLMTARRWILFRCTILRIAGRLIGIWHS